MKTKIMLLVSILLFSLTACEDFLDRPALTEENDDNFWTSETKLRLYANGYYTRYFSGYNVGGGTAYTPNTGYLLNDDIMANGSQEGIEISIPNSRGSTAADLSWLDKYCGPTWNFAWVRKSNIMIDRIQTKMGDKLTADQMNHWLGIARFFRGMEYAGLVTVFGDVPYYDHEVGDTDFDDLYKPRTPRNEVMDAVYADLDFALENVKIDDGAMNVNRYVVAGFVSRLALFEGTWQKYHKNDSERAKKFLNLAVKAANVVMTSGKYWIDTDFRSLFGSNSLAGKREVIFYRMYNTDLGVGHSVAHSCNMTESRWYAPTLALVKSFICNDGTDWQTSSDANNKNFDIANLIKTRDPRFEATFYKKTTTNASASCIYTVKFIPRDGLRYLDTGGAVPEEYKGEKSITNYPVMRLAEVMLNWIEAKAELATLGGSAVQQEDLDNSINKIRSRPLDADAIAAGVKKTADLKLTDLPDSPNRGDVPQLIWEIRRERRMEMAFEHSRLLDLRRWKKLEYMDATYNPDILMGTWIDANTPELKNVLLVSSNIGVMKVMKMDGSTVTYDGSNAASMVGFYIKGNIKPRADFLNVPGVNPYLAPVGRTQRMNYQDKGYELAQTEGWSSDL